MPRAAAQARPCPRRPVAPQRHPPLPLAQWYVRHSPRSQAAPHPRLACVPPPRRRCCWRWRQPMCGRCPARPQRRDRPVCDCPRTRVHPRRQPPPQRQRCRWCAPHRLRPRWPCRHRRCMPRSRRGLTPTLHAQLQPHWRSAPACSTHLDLALRQHLQWKRPLARLRRRVRCIPSPWAPRRCRRPRPQQLPRPSHPLSAPQLRQPLRVQPQRLLCLSGCGARDRARP